MHQEFHLDMPDDAVLVPRLDPRVTMLLAAATILAVVASARPWFPAFVFAGCLAGLLCGRMAASALATRLAGPLSVAILVGAVRSLVVGETPAFSIGFGDWRITATWEGLADGAVLGVRVAASLAVVLLLVSFTPMHRLPAALAWARVPSPVVEIAMLMYRYIFSLFEDMEKVFSVQRLRLGYATFFRSLQSMGSLAGVVVLRSIDQAERTHEAMVARGYAGRWPVARLEPLNANARVLLATGMVLVAATWFVAERWLP